MILLETTKKERLPLGFLSKGGKPTMNAVEMFYVYFKNGGTPYDTKVNPLALLYVREHFNFHEEGSFEMMILWGLNSKCLKSHTSKERALAMIQAKSNAFLLIQTTTD